VKRGLWSFLLKRLLIGLATLLTISLIIFAVTQLLPRDPARAILGRQATEQAMAVLRERLGLDRPPIEQYLDWLGGLVSFDLGNSLAGVQAPVEELIGGRVRNSFFLLGCAAAISIPLSVLLGSFAALRRDKLFDTSSSLLMLALAALPEFAVAVGLVVLFATTVWQVLPAVSIIPPGATPWADLRLIALPTLTLILAVTPYVARVMRASMVEVLESDYVEMARLKGLPERTVMWRHALPNALGPTLQVIALNVAYLAGGVIVVERAFNFPGIGLALRDAVAFRDLPVIQALAMLIAGVFVAANLAADLGTILVTPRLRTKIS
jgi:peptide/nickel transport system permease protein